MDINNVFTSIGSGFGATAQVVIIILIVGFVLLFLIGGLGFYFWNKKRYNLRVEMKKVRSDGNFVSAEWAKGLYSIKRGALFIKRKGIRGTSTVRLIDIRKYLQGEDILTVIQVGVDDLRPVIPSSFETYIETYVDDKTGKTIEVKESIMNIKADSGLNKPWKSAFENASKKAYSIVSFIQQFQTPIAIAIVIISLFVGFAIIFTKIGSVCGKA